MTDPSATFLEPTELPLDNLPLFPEPLELTNTIPLSGSNPTELPTSSSSNSSAVPLRANPTQVPNASSSTSTPVPLSDSNPTRRHDGGVSVGGYNVNFDFGNPVPRRSGRLAPRRESTAGIRPEVASVGLKTSKSKRRRSSELPEEVPSKVRVVEPSMVQDLQAQIDAQSKVIQDMELKIRSCDDYRTQNATIINQLKEKIEALQKEHAELEQAAAKAVEDLENAHRLEIEVINANFAEEVSVQNSLDSPANTAADRERLEEATKTLNAKDEEIRKYQSEKERLVEEQSILQHELTEAQSAKEAEIKLRSEIVTQLNDQREGLRTAQESAKTLFLSLRTTEQKLKSCQEEEEKQKSEVERLHQAIKAKDESHAVLASSNDALKDEVKKISQLLTQNEITLKAQGGFQGDLNACRRELALANAKAVQLAQQVNDLQQSAKKMGNDHSLELQTINKRLAESADEATRQMQTQRREILNEKNRALETEREASRLKDRLVQESRTTAAETREENKLLKERIEALEAENKRLGKRRSDQPPDDEDDEDDDVSHHITGSSKTRYQNGIRSPSVFSMIPSRRQELPDADVAMEWIESGESEDSKRDHRRPSVSKPVLSESKLASPFRHTPSRQSRQDSPDIAAPGTYRIFADSNRSVQRTSNRLTTPVPGPSSSGPSKRRPPHPDPLLSTPPPPDSSPRSPELTPRSSPRPLPKESWQRQQNVLQNSNNDAPPEVRGSSQMTVDDVAVARLQEILAQALSKMIPNPNPSTPSPNKRRYMASPFKSEAALRPRLPEHNYLMAQVRGLLCSLLRIKTDKDIAELDRSRAAAPEEVKNFERGHGPPPYLDPLRICFDDVKSKWNMYLAKLFALRLVRSDPSLEGQEDEIAEHFMRRIYALRSEFLKGLPREGETLEDTQARSTRDHQRILQDKRIRTRQIELKQRRIQDCSNEDTPEGDELATMVDLLGDDGVSSDESDGYGNRLVRIKAWRNRAIVNRMALADSKHTTTGVYGNRRPGAQLQRRIRRQNGPISKKKIPEGKPVNYYDPALYHSLCVEERLHLKATPRVPFTGEDERVDESLFD